MDDKLSIKISIGERVYPMKIDRDAEESFRKAATMINEKMSLYKQKFDGKDMFDFLAMTALQIAVGSVENLSFNNMDRFKNELNFLNEEIEKYIRESI